MSYITGNVLSNGGYESAEDFHGLPEGDRDGYRAHMENLRASGKRYAIITRETRTGDAIGNAEADPESELTVVVNPSPTWLADMFRQLPAMDSVEESGDEKRYYTTSATYYEYCSCHTGNQHEVNEQYHVSIHGLTPGKLAVVEAEGMVTA
ncbi:hypothetical protein SEA_TBRADY12_135 [Mycobacterium phage TBrady12]|nr:hypothetical protein SEA_TBRADY12_135 [Mycobacterium phage TBrady12]